MSNRDCNNEHCDIAAKMLSTEAGLLDYRLIERLNNVADMAFPQKLVSRQVIALLIIMWQEETVDDFIRPAN